MSAPAPDLRDALINHLEAVLAKIRDISQSKGREWRLARDAVAAGHRRGWDMSDDPRMRAARSWLVSRHYTDEAAEQLAPQMLAALDAVDPLRQRGHAVEALLGRSEAPTSSLDNHQRRGAAWDIIDQAINDCDAWMADDDYDAVGILTKIINRMKERRGFYLDESNIPAPSSPAWSPEMTRLIRLMAEIHVGRHGAEFDRAFRAAFPDPAREVSR